MENIAALLLGALASWVQGKTTVFPKWANFLISIAACFGFSMVMVAFDGYKEGQPINWDNTLTYLGLAFTGSQGFFNLYFKKILSK